METLSVNSSMTLSVRFFREAMAGSSTRLQVVSTIQKVACTFSVIVTTILVWVGFFKKILLVSSQGTISMYMFETIR